MNKVCIKKIGGKEENILCHGQTDRHTNGPTGALSFIVYKITNAVLNAHTKPVDVQIAAKLKMCQPLLRVRIAAGDRKYRRFFRELFLRSLLKLSLNSLLEDVLCHAPCLQRYGAWLLWNVTLIIMELVSTNSRNVLWRNKVRPLNFCIFL